MGDELEKRRVKSVETSCEIVDYLRRSNGSTVSEIAKQVDLSAGSVHTHLATLKEYGYVVQDGQTYRLGMQYLTLGEHIRNQNSVYQAAKEEIELLAKSTTECAHLIIEHQGRVLALYEVFGENAVGVQYHAKKREETLRHLHCTAAGKALLSRLPSDRVESILDEHGMEPKTDNTITDRETLFEELEDIRDRGFAVSDNEQMIGIRAVGAPIMHIDGRVAGAISVSGLSSRLKGDRFRTELPEEVMRAANVAAVNLNTDSEI